MRIRVSFVARSRSVSRVAIVVALWIAFFLVGPGATPAYATETLRCSSDADCESVVASLVAKYGAIETTVIMRGANNRLYRVLVFKKGRRVELHRVETSSPVSQEAPLQSTHGEPPPAGGRDYEGDDAGECTDRADNDHDGKFDCDDEGCANGPDCKKSEGDSPGECSDRADNDRDGRFDCDDPGCAGSLDCGAKRSSGPAAPQAATQGAEALERRLAELLRMTTCSEDGWSRAPKKVTVSSDGVRCATVVLVPWIQKHFSLCQPNTRIERGRSQDPESRLYRAVLICYGAEGYQQVAATTLWSEMEYVSAIHRLSLLTRTPDWSIEEWERQSGDYCVSIGRGRCLAITKDKAVAEEIAELVGELGRVRVVIPPAQ